MAGAVKLFLVVTLLLIAAQNDAISVSSPHHSTQVGCLHGEPKTKIQVDPCTCRAIYKPGTCPIADVCTQFDTVGS